MTNIEALQQIGILGDIRQRMGANDENDAKQDEEINRLDPDDLIAKDAGWKLGNEEWWWDMFDKYNDLVEVKKEHS